MASSLIIPAHMVGMDVIGLLTVDGPPLVPYWDIPLARIRNFCRAFHLKISGRLPEAAVLPP